MEYCSRTVDVRPFSLNLTKSKVGVHNLSIAHPDSLHVSFKANDCINLKIETFVNLTSQNIYPNTALLNWTVDINKCNFDETYFSINVFGTTLPADPKSLDINTRSYLLTKLNPCDVATFKLRICQSTIKKCTNNITASVKNVLIKYIHPLINITFYENIYPSLFKLKWAKLDLLNRCFKNFTYIISIKQSDDLAKNVTTNSMSYIIKNVKCCASVCCQVFVCGLNTIFCYPTKTLCKNNGNFPKFSKPQKFTFHLINKSKSKLVWNMKEHNFSYPCRPAMYKIIVQNNNVRHQFTTNETFIFIDTMKTCDMIMYQVAPCCTFMCNEANFVFYSVKFFFQFLHPKYLLNGYVLLQLKQVVNINLSSMRLSTTIYITNEYIKPTFVENYRSRILVFYLKTLLPNTIYSIKANFFCNGYMHGVIGTRRFVYTGKIDKVIKNISGPFANSNKIIYKFNLMPNKYNDVFNILVLLYHKEQCINVINHICISCYSNKTFTPFLRDPIKEDLNKIFYYECRKYVDVLHSYNGTMFTDSFENVSYNISQLYVELYAVNPVGIYLQSISYPDLDPAHD